MVSRQTPSSEEVRAQLERILVSVPFASATRSQRFLRYVLEVWIENHDESPKEYVIAIEVFDRDANYDPAIDATVRVEAGRLRTRLRDYYADAGKHDRLVIEIPRGSYRPAFYEHWEEPAKMLEEPVADDGASDSVSDSASRGSGKMEGKPKFWIALGSAALLLLILSLTLFSRPLAARLFRRDASPAIASLAVLPLDNLSGDPSQEYFADGMTDELITELAKESTLRIVSRTSVMQYKRAHRPLAEIARALNVDGVVEGSVTRDSDHVHLTLQLIRADTDVHLWANSCDRTPNDTVTLAGEAAREIAGRLNSSVPAGPAVRYVNPAAHDAYLHGLYAWYTTSNEKAGEYFRKAIELQPDYALGWAGVASYYLAGCFEGELDPRDALPKAEAAAAKAVALDDSLSEAHLVMAAVVYAGRWDWKWSEREIRRTVQLNPNFAEGWHLYAKLLGPLNRSDEAIAAQRKSIELDPFARPWAMAEILFVARRYDACLTEANQSIEAFPHNSLLDREKSQCFRGKGMMKESISESIASLKDSGDLKSADELSWAYAQGGFEAAVRWQIASTEKSAKEQYVSPVSLAQLHAQLGEREPTLSLLEEGFRQHSPHILWIQRYPEFDFLRTEPQYRSLVQRIGLPPLS